VDDVYFPIRVIRRAAAFNLHHRPDARFCLACRKLMFVCRFL
jgi:hypothetical protein